MGLPYNISAIITPDGLFDEVKYKAYSPLFLSATLQLAYGTQFAVITAVIVHTFREYLNLSLLELYNLRRLQSGTGATSSASSAVRFEMSGTSMLV